MATEPTAGCSRFLCEMGSERVPGNHPSPGAGRIGNRHGVFPFICVFVWEQLSIVVLGHRVPAGALALSSWFSSLLKVF